MDTNVDEYQWLDDTTLVFTACWQATVQLYRVTLDGWTTKLTDGQWDLRLGDVTDYQAYLLGHSMRQANEIYHLDIREWFSKDHEQMAHTEIYYDQPFDTYNQLLDQLTHENDNIYSQIERSTVEPRWQKTTDGKDMLTWIILTGSCPSLTHPICFMIIIWLRLQSLWTEPVLMVIAFSTVWLLLNVCCQHWHMRLRGATQPHGQIGTLIRN
jgi:hypothetical protein